MSAFVVLGVVGMAVLVGQLLFGDLAPDLGDASPSDLLLVAGGFVATAGFGGNLAHSAGAREPLAWLVGLAAGAVCVWLVGRLSRVVRGRRNRTDDLVD